MNETLAVYAYPALLTILAWLLDGINLSPHWRWVFLKITFAFMFFVILISIPSLSQNHPLIVLCSLIALVAVFSSNVIRSVGVYKSVSNWASKNFKWQWLRNTSITSLIVSLPIFLAAYPLAYPYINNLILSHQCSQRLILDIDSIEGNIQGNIKQVQTACNDLLFQNNNSNDVSALINRGRVSLVAWHRGGRIQQIEEATERTSKDFRKAYEIETFNPLAIFYKLYVREFKELVIEERKSCELALGTANKPGVYKPVIDLYTNNGTPQADHQNISIYIELAHFLTNRDKNYKLAEEFYKKIPDNDPTRVDVLMGFGNTYYLRGAEKTGIRDWIKSKDYYAEAFKLVEKNEVRRRKIYELPYNLGALEAKLSQSINSAYGDAIRHLSMAYEDSKEIGKTMHAAQRDLAFVYFLDRNYQKSQDNFALIPPEGRKNKFISNLIVEYQERAEQCKSLDFKGKPSCEVSSDDMKRLTTAGIFGNFIAHESIDPFFEIEHDRFYSCAS